MSEDCLIPSLQNLPKKIGCETSNGRHTFHGRAVLPATRQFVGQFWLWYEIHQDVELFPFRSESELSSYLETLRLAFEQKGAEKSYFSGLAVMFQMPND